MKKKQFGLLALMTIVLMMGSGCVSGYHLASNHNDWRDKNGQYNHTEGCVRVDDPLNWGVNAAVKIISIPIAVSIYGLDAIGVNAHPGPGAVIINNQPAAQQDDATDQAMGECLGYDNNGVTIYLSPGYVWYGGECSYYYDGRWCYGIPPIARYDRDYSLRHPYFYQHRPGFESGHGDGGFHDGGNGFHGGNPGSHFGSSFNTGGGFHGGNPGGQHGGSGGSHGGGSGGGGHPGGH